jgi:hypothetical protein
VLTWRAPVRTEVKPKKISLLTYRSGLDISKPERYSDGVMTDIVRQLSGCYKVGLGMPYGVCDRFAKLGRRVFTPEADRLEPAVKEVRTYFASAKGRA